MWFDGQRQPNTLYVANISRGKDSTAMLRAIQLLGWPLDMIVGVDVWFDDETPAELPPMVQFKDEYDRKVLEWFGVPVTRLCATTHTHTQRGGCPTAICSTESENAETTQENTLDSQCNKEHGARNSKPKKLTYCDIFYRKISPKRERERELQRGRNSKGNFQILGFPIVRGAWCQSDLKRSALSAFQVRNAAGVQGNSNGRHNQRLSLEERQLVSGQAQRKLARHNQRFPRKAQTVVQHLFQSDPP